MNTKSFLPKLATLGVVGLLAFSGQAWSAYLTVSKDTTSAGTTGPGTIYSLGVPSSHNYGNTFTSPGATFTGSGIYTFFDDIIFTIPSATANTISTTIDLGAMLQLTNLSQRIYNYSTNPGITLGFPVGGATVSWSTPIGSIGTVAVISATSLAAGTYVLQTRGTVTGTYGGSYAGTLNLAPVPVPAAAWLLGSGLLGLVGVARRRETA